MSMMTRSLVGRTKQGLAVAAASCLGLVLSGVAPASAEDLVFLLQNETSYDATEFYASPADVGGWEEDILGFDVLESGDAVRVTIADGAATCTYDLRTVFDDGEATEDFDVDLCSTGSYTLSE